LQKDIAIVQRMKFFDSRCMWCNRLTVHISTTTANRSRRRQQCRLDFRSTTTCCPTRNSNNNAIVSSILVDPPVIFTVKFQFHFAHYCASACEAIHRARYCFCQSVRPSVRHTPVFFMSTAKGVTETLTRYGTLDTLVFTARCTTVLRSHVVCLSVCPSVTLVDFDHIGWNSSE